MPLSARYVLLWVKPYRKQEWRSRTVVRRSTAAVSRNSLLLGPAVACCVGCLPRLQLPAGCRAVCLCIACRFRRQVSLLQLCVPWAGEQFALAVPLLNAGLDCLVRVTLRAGATRHLDLL